MKSSGIGGQAVLEGVMMKNKSRYSVAVRTPDGTISTKTGNCRSVADKHAFFRLPVIRGVVNFVESLILGMQTLTYSSSFYEEEDTPGRDKEKKLDKAGNDNMKESIENVLIVLLAILLAVGIFMLLPFFLSELLRSKIHSQTTLALLEGILRIILFLGYVIAISFLGDIKRVFMYHGAEHKTINCVEHGLDLTVENVRKQTKHHRRCGTSFLLIVMFVSIIFFLFIHIDNVWLRMLFRILLIPVIAGVSYEFIRLAGSTDNKVVLWLSTPGMLLQRLTTREPDDSMIEVAIASVEAVFDWKAYQEQLAAEGDSAAERRERRRKASSEPKTEDKRREAGADKQKKAVLQNVRSGLREKMEGAFGNLFRSRAQKKKELAEREMEYHKRALERARRMKEQAEREAERERMYQDIEKRRAARKKENTSGIPAPKVEVEQHEDELQSLDHFLDE